MPGKPKSVKTKLIAVRLPEMLLKRIDLHAGAEKLFKDKTEFIRRACVELTENLERYVVTRGEFKDRDRQQRYFAFLHNGEYRVVRYDESIPAFASFAEALHYMGRGGIAELESDEQHRERARRLEVTRKKGDEPLY